MALCAFSGPFVAVGFSFTCVRCAPVYAPFTRRVAVYAARLSRCGGAVRWFAGCAAVTSLQYFPTPTLRPLPGIGRRVILET